MPIVRLRFPLQSHLHSILTRRLRTRAAAALGLGLACAGAFGLASLSLEAASTSFWLVSTQTDFLKGEVEQLTVDTDGRVMLGPAVETLAQTSTPAVWRLALDTNGNVWAGTGNEGKVL